ncbi:hypothetical protein KSF_104610 [Reticulibacter mediterranei]|uniref:Uncharacterized protein n=1 Tax=Reticulibacter mediterranei TaxID=2778369 RepID=A0A8J3ITS5_9CHLR|nr:hypothetical protein [Reticulibacter mediterranei]GHP00414.1 hypothetical protein KSF_104610 [Reticulibacter mediterranei]
MSTTSLPESQPARCVEYTVRPDISLYQALRSRFLLDQITYTVGDCPDDIFKRFITLCSQTVGYSKYWKPLHLHKLLHMLDQDCSDVARWYAIEILLTHRVIVPLKRNEGKQVGRASVA